MASRLGPRFYDWQLVQSADESRRECHLHARNLLGAHGYALRIIELIERQVTEGTHYLDLLTDRFKRDLLGEVGMVTVLTEIRAREIANEDAYWTTVTELRNSGHLSDSAHRKLLARLGDLKLVGDTRDGRQGDHNEPDPAAGVPSQGVAEAGAGYQAALFQKKRQQALFE